MCGGRDIDKRPFSWPHIPQFISFWIGRIMLFCKVITALFTIMRNLKFKSQLTIALVAAVNHLNGPLRKQNFTVTGSKSHGF